MNKEKIEKRITINGEEYLTAKMLSVREGFSYPGMLERIKKIGLQGERFDFSKRVLYSLKEVEEAEKQGKFIKFK